jgi:hypothetical protein
MNSTAYYSMIGFFVLRQRLPQMPPVRPEIE